MNGELQDTQPGMTVEQVRGSLDLTDSGAIKNSMRMGNTTYVIGVHFSTESKDTLEDKMKRLMRDDVKTDNF